ncbi:uncharacterized protein UV8b_01389 [Ustilaginoidea virens]|uniref:Uncharacterized protein n=1 Tax=Ustilaginoidea virens TaxID=1159556 RepID=A0A8E5MEC7_USTVR|nr:uncharacterized protein UV8b_01389 [Ustilaginoidea virens]QUC17148.1 hypothetical protein UV8b_01389 [Ustilaginoidea virens]
MQCRVPGQLGASQKQLGPFDNGSHQSGYAASTPGRTAKDDQSNFASCQYVTPRNIYSHSSCKLAEGLAAFPNQHLSTNIPQPNSNIDVRGLTENYKPLSMGFPSEFSIVADTALWPVVWSSSSQKSVVPSPSLVSGSGSMGIGRVGCGVSALWFIMIREENEELVLDELTAVKGILNRSRWPLECR